MADQQFCLRWNNHQSTLISVFDTLLENGTLVDCTLAAEGQYLKAHKVVLCACSPYLETLLSQHYEKHPIVILKDVKFSELKSMMDYMYRGEVNISQDQLGTFLKAAESLQIKGLSDNGADGDARDVGSTPKAPPPRKATQPAPSSRPEPVRPDSPLTDGSMSPSSRKRRRVRRSSQDDDSHLESNSCDLPNQAQSTPVPNIPVATSSITTTPIVKPAIVKPEQTDVNRIDSNSLPPESLKKEIEPISEPLLEPKTEYLEDMNNEDSVEDLTLDDDDDMEGMDISNMSNMSNMSRPGPSHGNDISNQSFAPWQLGANQSGTDEVFMAAQEAVNQHRDSQDLCLVSSLKTNLTKRRNQAEEYLLKGFTELDQATLPPKARADTVAQFSPSTNDAGVNKDMEEMDRNINKIKIRSDLFDIHKSEMKNNDNAQVMQVESETEIQTYPEEWLEVESIDLDKSLNYESPNNFLIKGFSNECEAFCCEVCNRQTKTFLNSSSSNRGMEMSALSSEAESSSDKNVQKNTCFEIKNVPEKGKESNNVIDSVNLMSLSSPSETVVPQIEASFVPSTIVSKMFLSKTKQETNIQTEIEREPNGVTNPLKNINLNILNEIYSHTNFTVPPLIEMNDFQNSISVSTSKIYLSAKENNTTFELKSEPKQTNVNSAVKNYEKNVTLQNTNPKNTKKISSLKNKKIICENSTEPNSKTVVTENYKIVKTDEALSDFSGVSFKFSDAIMKVKGSVHQRKKNFDSMSRKCISEHEAQIKKLLNHGVGHSSRMRRNYGKKLVKKLNTYSDEKPSEKNSSRCDYCYLLFNSISELNDHHSLYHSEYNLFF